MKEVWKKVPGLSWYYEVSNRGRLRSLSRVDRHGHRRKKRILKATDAEFEADGKWCSLAQCILLAFIGPPRPKQRCARHLDDNRTHNHLDNLAWGTDLDNQKDKIRNGSTGKGRRISEKHIAALRTGHRRYYERM